LNLEKYTIDAVQPTCSLEVHINNRGNLYREIEVNIDLYHSGKGFQDYQQLFFSNKTNPYDSERFHVAIHIRRLNSCDIGTWGTSTPDSYHLKVINTIREDFKEKNPVFHIYSQGEQEVFEAFRAEDTIFHLNEDLLQTFNGMIFADVLATTTSSISYVAALLSKGIIYHQPFWHKPLSKWIIVEKE
jgi:hypothetical protein